VQQKTPKLEAKEKEKKKKIFKNECVIKIKG